LLKSELAKGIDFLTTRKRKYQETFRIKKVHGALPYFIGGEHKGKKGRRGERGRLSVGIGRQDRYANRLIFSRKKKKGEREEGSEVLLWGPGGTSKHHHTAMW